MTAPDRSFGPESTAADVLRGVDVEGRVIAITGCTSGIGFAAMSALTERGATVLGLARRLDDARAARERVRHPELVIPWECDLGDLASVAACADALGSAWPVLDSLVCNAGVYFLPERSTIAGVEKHFAINHLGHFLLIARLLTRLEAARQGRVVIVASEIHAEAGPLDLAIVAGEGVYDPTVAYAQSKLANVIHGMELARRTLGTGVTANVVSPMWVMTETMRRHLATRDVARGEHVAKSPEQGAAALCHAATAPELELVTGRYFENCRPVRPAPAALDRGAAAELWDCSVALVEERLGALG
jgi:Dehydrogenases with different specificities (related to short-chain alcohol dehydrogenases)